MARKRTSRRATPESATLERTPNKAALLPKTEPTLACRFYKTDRGNEPVREWLKALPSRVRNEIGSDIQVVQWRWPIGKPLVDGFGEGLWEVRTALEGNIYRVLFCVEGPIMILLHGIAKKTKKTPHADVELARKRMREEVE